MVDWGDYSSSRKLEIVPADVEIGSISAPVANSVHTTSVEVVYNLVSYKGLEDDYLCFVTDFDKEGDGIDARTWVLGDIDIEYSTEGTTGTFADCTDLGNDESEGKYNLVATKEGTSHTFYWDVLTDLGTAVLSQDVVIRIRATDNEVDYSDYVYSSSFIVDTLPSAPSYDSDSYSSTDKDKDTTPEFHFVIPTDPGDDFIHFLIEIDTSSSFDSNEYDSITKQGKLSRNSVEHYGFYHYHNNDSPGGSYTGNDYKRFGDWVFEVTLTGADSQAGASKTINFGDYKDFFKHIYLPSEFINPRVLVMPESDALIYITNITQSSVTLNVTSDTGFSDVGGTIRLLVYIFEDTWDEYWVSNLSCPSSSKTFTLGSGDFTTDDNNSAISSSVTNAYVFVQPTSDCVFYINQLSSGSTSSFTVYKSSNLGNPSNDSSDTFNVFILKDYTDTYRQRGVAYSSSVSGNTLSITGSTDSNGESRVSTYLPGAQILAMPNTDTFVYLESSGSTAFYVGTSLFVKHTEHSSKTTGVVDMLYWGCNADTFWVPITPNGIPDDYEGEKAKFQVQPADSLGQYDYYWRVAAGN